MQNLVEEIYSAIEERGVIVTLGKVFGVGASVELPVAESICQESVERLALSVRSQNCSMRAGIDTIERLMDAIMENRLAGVRSLGKKSLAEIRAKLCEFAYESLTESKKKAFILNEIEINKGVRENGKQ